MLTFRRKLQAHMLLVADGSNTLPAQGIGTELSNHARTTESSAQARAASPERNARAGKGP